MMMIDGQKMDGQIADRYRKNDGYIDDNKAKVAKCQHFGNLDEKYMALGRLAGSVGGACDS